MRNILRNIPPGIWVLVAVIAVVVGLALFGYFTGASEAPPNG